MWSLFSRRTPQRGVNRWRKRGFRPRVEALEERCCPSIGPGAFEWADPTGGSPDPSFGSGGTVATAPLTGSFWINTRGGAGTVQPDGKVIVVGSTYMANSVNSGYIDLVRYNANGTLDTGFGSGGIVTTKYGSRLTAIGATLDPTTGKIVVLGVENNALHLVRYNTNGTVDKTFGSRGDVLVSFTQGNFGQGNLATGGIVVESLGGVPKFLVYGNVGNSSNTTWAMARFNLDGTLDTSFGTGGRVTDDLSPTISGNWDGISGVAFRPDGTFLAVGQAMTSVQAPNGVSYQPELVLAHYDTAGRRDLTFGSGGTAVILDGLQSLGYAIALQPDGKIIVGGNATNFDSVVPDVLLAQFNADGSLDGAFPGGGYFTTHLDGSTSFDHLYSVALQSDGTIILAAGCSNGPLLLRYHSDGTPEAGFGIGGRAPLPFFSGGQDGVILLSDGRIVVTGSANNALGAIRFLASAPQIGSFTATPNPVTSGSSTTLRVSNITDQNPNATVAQVAFYIQLNGNWVLLGDGTHNSDGSWAYAFDGTGYSAGTYTIAAQATDSYGALGNPVALTLPIQ